MRGHSSGPYLLGVTREPDCCFQALVQVRVRVALVVSPLATLGVKLLVKAAAPAMILATAALVVMILPAQERLTVAASVSLVMTQIVLVAWRVQA